MCNRNPTFTMNSLYDLDDVTRARLIDSAPLVAGWSHTECAVKDSGGMEEWVKVQHDDDAQSAPAYTCDWYHGTWQYLRLLNMVAVPPWYPFYHETLSAILRAKPKADVLISAAADYGMLCTLHEAALAVGASPKITLCDICRTPLIASQWFAEQQGFEIDCICDDLLSTPALPLAGFDLIVTDEFLTVLKDPDKPQIVARWKELLAPGGALVTTGMVGAPTTAALRKAYGERAQRLLELNIDELQAAGANTDELESQFEQFANCHTRHMFAGEDQLRTLFAGFQLESLLTVTPGECVTPTSSFQIVARAAIDE